MSLATRCTSCGTVFRVVQDQLKVSEGWVRCGRCRTVFNALEGLFDLERDAAPPWTPEAAREVGGAILDDDNQDTGPDTEFLVDPHDPHGHLAWGEEPAPPAALDLSHGATDPAPAAAAPAVEVLDHGHLEPAHATAAGASDDWPVSDPGAETVLLPREDLVDDASNEAAAATPEFVRRAQRQARWQHPGLRLALALFAVALGLALAAQAAFQFRSQIAVRWPTLQPLLASTCEALGCRLDAPRRIDDVAVESSSLTNGAAPDTYALALTLRNRGAYKVMLPAIELSLTDGNGQLVSRRVLTVHDFRANPAPLNPGADLALQLLFDAAGAHVAGYTVEIFYP